LSGPPATFFATRAFGHAICNPQRARTVPEIMQLDQDCAWQPLPSLSTSSVRSKKARQGQIKILELFSCECLYRTTSPRSSRGGYGCQNEQTRCQTLTPALWHQDAPERCCKKFHARACIAVTSTQVKLLSVQTLEVEPHSLEARHEHRQQCTTATKVHHLGPNSRV